mmetsp:Transcript_17362/g.44201  ORF Transcript_17362/g.44201 Transcript_17362/m.44201 type:complete len:308 (-) Transcript_17362:138-1061(-)
MAADQLDTALKVSADGQYEPVEAHCEVTWARPERGVAWTTGYVDGREYLGSFQGWTFHGRGYLQWPDGRIYIGQFRCGRRHGMGRQRWPDDYTYAGDWKHGRRHGHGTYRDPAGRVIRGLWIEDRCVLAPADPHRFETDEDGEPTLPSLGASSSGSAAAGGGMDVGDDESLPAACAFYAEGADQDQDEDRDHDHDHENMGRTTITAKQRERQRRRHEALRRNATSMPRISRAQCVQELRARHRRCVREAEKSRLDARARSIEERQKAWREEMNLAFDLEHFLKCSPASPKSERPPRSSKTCSSLIFQ